MSDERYHDAAAVVTRFEIRPAYHNDLDAAKNLLADSVLVDESAGRQQWSLKNESRKRVLARLRTRSELQRAITSAAVRPTDVLQQTLESWIFDRPKSLDAQTPQELAATLQVIDWLEPTELAQHLPESSDVRLRVERDALFKPFRDLAGEFFKGRARELSVLRDYLQATSPPSDASRTQPLLVHGPGGVGKSTLLSRLILDLHADQAAVVVYLDCDRPGLIAEEPVTLLAEAVRQFGLQIPHLYESAGRLRESWLQDLARFRADASDALETVSLESAATRDRSTYLDQFALFARDIPAERSILLVIDTFEEVQYRSRDFVGELFRFIDELRERLPVVRVIVSGRDDIEGFPLERFPLTSLDAEAAEGYLEARGVQDPELRRALARALHGNPLSLRLAATLVSSETGSRFELADLERIRDDTEIQGILYGRIIRHIHDRDEEVQRIAHPGLILRRITKDLIRNVLAGPCGLMVDSDARADDLFNRLRAELTLVIDEGTVVRHRPDVRRVMLPALRAAEPQRTDDIQRAAISWYSQFDDAISRGEEIYHRLMLGQPPNQIEPRWTVAGVDDLLRSAVPEVTGSARSYLASRLRLELYEDIWDEMAPVVWESNAARRAEDLIRLDRPQEGLSIVQRRSLRSAGSPLYWLEARLLRQLGRLREARQVARAGMESVQLSELGPEHVDLWILAAEVDEALRERIDWPSVVQRYRILRDRLPDMPRTLRFALPYLRRAVVLNLHTAEVQQLADAALEQLRKLPESDLQAVLPELPVLPAFQTFLDGARRSERIGVKRDAGEAWVLAGVDRAELVACLREATPTTSDLAIVLKELGEDFRRIGGGPFPRTFEEALDRVVWWAEGTNRIGDLVSAAAKVNPGATALQNVLARRGTRLEVMKIDPFDVVLMGERPIFGRRILREFTRDILSGRMTNRVLIVTGPAGSGKSYTGQFLRYVQSTTGAFELAQVRTDWDVEAVIGWIYTVLNWRQEPRPVGGDSEDRWLIEQADAMINKARRSSSVTVLVFDNQQSLIHPLVGKFVSALTRRVYDLKIPMAIVLCGFNEKDVPVQDMLSEKLEYVSRADVLDAIQRIAPRLSSDEAAKIWEDIARILPPPGPYYNASLNRLAADNLRLLARENVPVRVFVSYAHQDSPRLDEVLAALRPLETEGLVRLWTDRDIPAGSEWRVEITRELAKAEVVLPVVTKAFRDRGYGEELDVPELLRQGKRILQVVPGKETGAAFDPALSTVDMSHVGEALRTLAVDLRTGRGNAAPVRSLESGEM